MAHVYKIYPKKKRNFFSGLSVNTTLILLNIIAFVIFTLLVSLKIIPLDFIALKPSNIFHGKYLWTFLTSMFMHAPGALLFFSFHLFANMLTLLFIGGLIERILGAKRYFYFYLFSGLFAGIFFVLLSLIFTKEFNTFAVGASGALFGLIGLLVILTPNLPVFIMFIPIPIKMKYAAPGILIVLWIISIVGNIGIGNTAHLGGLITGLAYGIYLRNKYKNKTKYISKIFS